MGAVPGVFQGQTVPEEKEEEVELIPKGPDAKRGLRNGAPVF